MLRVVIALVLTVAPAFSETVDEVFERGLAAYQKHDYPAARDHFVAASKLASPTARLLHNLALTYYQMNQKAFALAYWRQALTVDPNFAAARVGRELLEGRLNMRPFEQDGFDLLRRHALERVSPFLISWIFAVLFSLSMWLSLRHVLDRRAAKLEDRDAPRFPWATAGISVLALLSGLTLASRAWDISSPRATIVGAKSEARSLPNDKAVSLFDLPAGGEVLVLRSRDGWTQVQKQDGATGWLPDSELVITSEI